MGDHQIGRRRDQPQQAGPVGHASQPRLVGSAGCQPAGRRAAQRVGEGRLWPAAPRLLQLLRQLVQQPARVVSRTGLLGAHLGWAGRGRCALADDTCMPSGDLQHTLRACYGCLRCWCEPRPRAGIPGTRRRPPHPPAAGTATAAAAAGGSVRWPRWLSRPHLRPACPSSVHGCPGLRGGCAEGCKMLHGASRGCRCRRQSRPTPPGDSCMSARLVHALSTISRPRCSCVRARRQRQADPKRRHTNLALPGSASARCTAA